MWDFRSEAAWVVQSECYLVGRHVFLSCWQLLQVLGQLIAPCLQSIHIPGVLQIDNAGKSKPSIITFDPSLATSIRVLSPIIEFLFFEM